MYTIYYSFNVLKCLIYYQMTRVGLGERQSARLACARLRVRIPAMVTSILGACELCLLQYLETHGETGGFAIYCQPRHKGSLILSQDSVGGILEDGSPRRLPASIRAFQIRNE